MPKQRAWKKNDAAHQGSREPLERSKAPQAAVHRRGGTHKVRDGDKTNSIYDTYNYRELVDAAKERGIYCKDMKKVKMAWALKRNDAERKRTEREKLNAIRKKQQEAKREKDRIAAEKAEFLKAKYTKRVEKMMKRERNGSVSDDTLSETEVEAAQETRNKYEREAVGQPLSDTSWDSSSTESVSDFTDEIPKASCKLQLLEWPYQTMPPNDPNPSTPHFLSPQPRKMPYVPLRVTTTLSKRKICLPSLKHLPDRDPDFAPLLPASVRTAAHEGRLEGILRTASIETGEEWASRTLVQGRNGTLYFHPSNIGDPTKSLASVYEKWNLEKRKLARENARYKTRSAVREERKRQKRRYKSRMMAEVYEACKWRPGAVGYIPAYLDFGTRAGEDIEQKRSLGNLRYVRFNGCDVPHYYFWINDEQGDEEDGKLEKVCQRAVVSARKKPYKTHQPPLNCGSDGNEASIHNETEGVLEEIASDTSAEGLFRKASATSMFSEETDRTHSITQWLDHIEPSCNASPTSMCLLEPSDIAGRNGKDDLRGWEEAILPILE